MELYLIFALSTAITLYFLIFLPVSKNVDEEHVFARSFYISSTCFGILMFILAPIAFPLVVSDKLKNSFIRGLTEQ